MKGIKFISLLALLVVGLNAEILGEKINGVYFGALISEKNTLVITTSKSRLTGYCYLNKSDKLSFTGTYVDKQLKGSIQLQDGGEVTLEGHLENGTLKLNYVIDNQQKTTSLVKFTSNDRYDINDVYSDVHDPLLVGIWESVKEIDTNGVSTSEGKLIMEFESNGRKTMQMISIPARIRSKLPPGADLHKKLEYSWQTEGPNLITSFRSPKGDVFPASIVYTVEKDTLKTFGKKMTSVYVRK